jgi:arylsulfatase A-like enzyme
MAARAGVLPYIGRSTSSENKPPNVLIIQTDQHRGTIMGCAGHNQVRTPNLDKLASEGIRFTNCISGGPVCSPFRATFQTGLYCHKHGVDRNNTPLDPEHRTIGEEFTKGGYATGYIGKWHLGGLKPKDSPGGFIEPGEQRQGWHDWNGYERGHEYFKVWKFNEHGEKVRVKGYDWEPSWHTDMALSFAKKHSQQHKPWCYYLSYGPPHLPLQCPKKYLDVYDLNKIILPRDLENTLNREDLSAIRKIYHVYYAQVTAVDYEIGRLMKGLKALGLDDNTIVLYTSDHGDVLGRHRKYHKGKYRGKGLPFESAFRIPLILRWPNKISTTVCDTLVNSVDLAPTILDLAGLPEPKQFQGDSMAPWCLNGNGPQNQILYLGLRGITSLNWFRAVWDGRYILAVFGAKSEKSKLLTDNQRDPYEERNFVEDSLYHNVKKKLEDALIWLSEKTEDPLHEKLKETISG